VKPAPSPAEIGAAPAAACGDGGRFRWAVLAAGVLAQGAFVAVPFGLPSIAAPLRAQTSASPAQLGAMLGAPTVGMVVTLYLWGRLADRFGEGRVAAAGLLGAGAGLAVAAAVADTTLPLIAALAAAGMFGSSANTASSRAVMTWFPGRRRGFAMGVRQTALPLAGAVSAGTLPPIALSYGVGAAFTVLAVGCVLAGVVAWPVLSRPAPDRPVPDQPVLDPHSTGRPVPDLSVPGLPVADRSVLGQPIATRPAATRLAATGPGRSLRTICVISGLLVVPQITLTAFGALYLHDEHGLSVPTAAGVLAGGQLLGAAGRIGTGVWSDQVGSRMRPLAIVIAGQILALTAIVIVSASSAAPLPLLCACLMVGVMLTMSWNTLGVVIAGEAAQPGRAGAALGLQNTIAVGFGGLTPIFVAPLLAVFGWTAVLGAWIALPALAFPLAAQSLRQPGATARPFDASGRP
jgi:MFS family permease